MTQDWEDDLHLARLSIDDLDELARAWQQRAQEEGDATSSAVAKALESVVRQRRVAAAARDRVLAAQRAWAPLRQAARWAVLRR